HARPPFSIPLRSSPFALLAVLLRPVAVPHIPGRPPVFCAGPAARRPWCWVRESAGLLNARGRACVGRKGTTRPAGVPPARSARKTANTHEEKPDEHRPPQRLADGPSTPRPGSVPHRAGCAVRQRGRGHALRRARPQGQPGGRVAVLVRRGDRAGVRCPDPPRGRDACRGLPQLRDHGLRLLHRAPAGRLVPAPERRPRPRAVLLGLPAAGVLRPRLPGPRGRPEPVRFPPGRPSPPPPAGRPLTAAEPTAPRARTASAPCPAAGPGAYPGVMECHAAERTRH